MTGLDFSEKMLEIAQAKIEKEQLKNINLVQGDAMALPFEDETFDVVTIGYGLRNTPDYLTVLKEIYRVLKKKMDKWLVSTHHTPLYLCINKHLSFILKKNNANFWESLCKIL